jgi:hypothetical protein
VVRFGPRVFYFKKQHLQIAQPGKGLSESFKKLELSPETNSHDAFEVEMQRIPIHKTSLQAIAEKEGMQISAVHDSDV